MALSSLVYALWVFWLVVYGVQRLIQYRSSEPILPSHRRGRNWDLRLTIRFLRARVETSRWNGAHDKLLARLKRRGDSWSRTWLERFYTLGYVSGMIGMAVAFGLLLWTTWTLVRPLSIHKIGVPRTVGKLMKRDLTPESPITPILPGVTVPLNHIPVIIISLFLSQVVHELGHAIAGALHGIPILSAGVSITVCIPAAFVSFSTATLDTLRPSAKSRVIAAGPFHNLLFWCFWVLAGFVSNGVFFTLWGYKDISSLGRVVLNIDDDVKASPLTGHLAPGTIITKLNDHSMASSHSEPDPWASFLMSTKNDEIGLGWCVNTKDFDSSLKECCLPDGPTSSSLSCFVANTTPNQIGCLDPVPVLTSTDDSERCASENACQEGYICVRPAEKEALLRLTVKESEEKLAKIVLWSGPRREIWNEVTVGKWLPRFHILPMSLPLWASTFWEYFLMVNLSLFLFNLIPIGGLDGLHLLRSTLASLAERGQRDVYDLGTMERAGVPEVSSRKYEYLEKAISGGAGLLVGLDFVLAVLALIWT